jgi:hypothetical protein
LRANTNWQLQFKSDVANLLNISDTRIQITSFAAGSVIVDFSIGPAADGSNIAVNAVIVAFQSPQSIVGFSAVLVYAGFGNYGSLNQSPAQAPAAAISSSSSAGIIVAALVAAVLIVVVGIIGYKRFGRGTSGASNAAASRPAMMSPSATAYITEEDPQNQRTQSAANKRARKLSF